MKGCLADINELTRVTYDRAAERYHDLFQDELAGKEYDRRIFDLFSQYFSPESVVYDMGCGPSGHIAGYLHDKGLQVIGVDISERCVKIASSLHPAMKFRRMDFSKLKLADRSVDGIISYHSLIHTPKSFVPGIIREFHRVLIEGGKLLVAVKKGEQEGFLEDFLGQDTRIFFSHFQKEEIGEYLTGNRFQILLLEERTPYKDEILISRIYCIGEKL